MQQSLAPKLLLIVSTAVVLPLIASSQDNWPLHPRYTAQVYSETSISGIDLNFTTIEQVIQRLGKPDRVERTYGHFFDESFRESETERLASIKYEWQTTNWRLRIITVPDSQFRQIDVWGTRADGAIGSTGHGLSLGDSLQDAQRIYELRRSFHASLPGSQIGKFVFHEPEDDLQVGVDRNGKICHLRLSPPCCEF
ncbi:MAG TPA: hypothetical protein VKR59_22525 [Terriglobales bacterium]|nr:hypothetical protein [Terriglobales bacterium]